MLPSWGEQRKREIYSLLERFFLKECRHALQVQFGPPQFQDLSESADVRPTTTRVSG
jgi:hypothetical protein